MNYSVQVIFHVYLECVLSLLTYMSKPSHKHYELWTGWAASVKKAISSRLHQQISDLYQDKKQDVFHPILIGFYGILSHKEWMDEQNPIRVIHWIEQLPVEELVDQTSLLVQKKPLPSAATLHYFRNRWVQILYEWNEQYFRQVDSQIITGLKKDALEKQKWFSLYPVEEQVEKATNGLYIQPGNGVDRVYLFPQYHSRPFNIIDYDSKNFYIGYSADPLPTAEEEPPPSLTRMTHALSDPNRLKILRFLGDKTRSFSEIAQEIGLSKSTVHHHLVALRAAGMIRVLYQKSGHDRYQLRGSFIPELAIQLQDYMKKGMG
ncbi:ArsR/SmtB family transcription factor [Lihuaxuella thermophila]|uniref:DNA-binding transcriptional regulator, ArsR family n=1 Tax=Lihuaxuella thermophila TaxID=1173111 RepID=A0A1H8AFQ6_9BACL|nr:winged helix-turn-helix domain-containing protein [Lihuaxuella thermophila]SEM69570.1 DNA-binding transcriptional regulator, ArsR family [Lihuaxuella thermophila]